MLHPRLKTYLLGSSFLLVLSFIFFIAFFSAFGDGYFKFPSVVLSEYRVTKFSDDLHLGLSCERNDDFATSLLSSLVRDSGRRDVDSIRKYTRLVGGEYYTNEELMEKILQFYGSTSWFENYCTYKSGSGYRVLARFIVGDEVKTGILNIEESGERSFVVVFEAVSTASEYSKAVGLWWTLSGKEKDGDSFSHFRLLVKSISGLGLIKSMGFDSGGALVCKEYLPSHENVRQYKDFIEGKLLDKDDGKHQDLTLVAIIPFEFGAVMRFSGETDFRMYLVNNEAGLRLAKREEFRVLDGVLGQLQKEGWPESRVFAKSFLTEIFYVMRLELVLSILMSLLVLVLVRMACRSRGRK